MTDHPGNYPSGQICYPPRLPTYLKEVCDLKPIVGVPTDDQLVGIHAVIQTANRALGIPGMHDPGLVMRLANHLFDVQMAKYRSKYSLITFPSDATYTPPTLPAHASTSLQAVSGAPSDDEIMKVQDAVRSYQHFSGLAPSMFDPQINMELSQHLFDLQMARHVQVAGNTQPTIISPGDVGPTNPAEITKRTTTTAGGSFASANNAGTGAHAPVGHPGPQSTAGGVSQAAPLHSKDHSREKFGGMSPLSVAITLCSAAAGVCLHYVGVWILLHWITGPCYPDLLTTGIVLYMAGLTLILGPAKTCSIFSRPQKLHGTICFIGGAVLVCSGLFGHYWAGLAIEVFGFFTVFGGLFPGIILSLRQLPIEVWD